MEVQTQPRALGILNLERGSPPEIQPVDPRPGHLFHPATFNFPIVVETVEGAWADRVLRGDPSLEDAYVESAKRLVARGAVAISANCGFTIRHQSAIAAAVRVPVATSSLMLIPALLTQLPPQGKLAIITADSQLLTQDVLGLSGSLDRSKLVIAGVEGGRLWQNEMLRPTPRTSVEDIEADVLECIDKVRKLHPEVAALLFECTAFPTVSAKVRQTVGLPVYDITDLCRLTFASVS